MDIDSKINEVEKQIKDLKNNKRYIKLLTSERNKFEDREFRNIQTNIKTLEIRRDSFKNEQFMTRQFQNQAVSKGLQKPETIKLQPLK